MYPSYIQVVSWLFPGCILGVFRLYAGCIQTVSWLYPGCTLTVVVSRLYPGCILVYPGSIQAVSGRYPGCILAISGLYPGCIQAVSGLYPGCILGVSSSFPLSDSPISSIRLKYKHFPWVQSIINPFQSPEYFISMLIVSCISAIEYLN